jgi:7-cyano-7-deazaguanine synthase in queuosine biosynthesis
MQNAVISHIKIGGSRENIYLTGDVLQSLRMLVEPFFRSLPRLPSERCIDLLNIAAGIYAVDRLIKRNRGSSYCTSRSCAITAAVRDMEFWNQPAIKAQIEEIILFLTDEYWEISFEPAPKKNGEGRHQHPLRLPTPYQAERVALYSGGLDSAAGLANQLIAGVHKYVLVTIGHQAWLRKKTTQQLQSLQDLLQIPPLLHSTIVTGLRGRCAVPLNRQERTQRTRSLLFAACAVAVASVFDIQQIEVFENGLGSINFPIMTGAMFGGLTTRGAHPTFLREMAALGSAVVEYPLVLSLPFARWTKAQMLMPLRDHGLALWAQTSRSCVHSSWRIAGKTHCGTCPACIERRQAFATAEIAESDYYSTDVLRGFPKSGVDADYLRLYLDEARAWLDDDPRPRRRLYAHLRLTDVPLQEDDQIALLHMRHSREVASVFRYHGSPNAAHRWRRYSQEKTGT